MGHEIVLRRNVYAGSEVQTLGMFPQGMGGWLW